MRTHGFEAVGEEFVPNIDISAFISDPSSPLVEETVEQVRRACQLAGFFQITGHGLPNEVLSELFAASKKFFALPMEEKKKLDARETIGRRGYDVLASQTYHKDVLPDLKEGFYVGHDFSPEDPFVRARRFFMGPNVWPQDDRLSSSEFRAPVERYFAAVHGLALRVLSLVARTLPYGDHVFADFVQGHVVAPLRLLHYPPARDPTGAGSVQLGAGAHTDFGAITLLLQDGQPGLEVLDSRSNSWVPIAPTPGAFVVNVGDMLSAWTAGEYKSSVHRVVNRQPVDRYSAAFFFDGDLDCRLDPLDGSPPAVANWTVEKHMIKRIQDSYGGGSERSTG
ncbi:putative 2OG-Fe(II) oxygenase family oxidoreductase [Thozetella sp. PMI_491]|nr:putative 2OG-Fe(II) oxygenase family oxidoreductase [Thozetella sp. PMI_491]